MGPAEQRAMMSNESRGSLIEVVFRRPEESIIVGMSCDQLTAPAL